MPHDISSALPQQDHATLVGKMAELTVVTATQPSSLTKTIRLDENGKLVKEGGGLLIEGTAEIVDVDGLEGLAEIVHGLRSDQALIYGLPPEREIRLITKDAWEAAGRPAGTCARTKEHFSYPDGLAFMMIDYDPAEGRDPLDHEALVGVLRESVPGLADTKMLWWPSASSCIVNEGTGEKLAGVRGQRIVFMVNHGTDIERAGRAICEHLWAAGHGRYDVSVSGQLLDHPLVDKKVWQPNRIDFAAGAACEPPLKQERGRPVIIPGSVHVVDTASAIPEPDTATARTAEANKRTARDRVEYEAMRAREEKVRRELDALPHNATTDERAAAEATLRQAVERQVLGGDYPVIVMENGREATVTVGELLNDRHRYDGLLTLDPLEPEYMGRKVVGKLYLSSGRPNLFSFAHGGSKYVLQRQDRRVTVTAGGTHRAVDETLDILRTGSDLYDFGDTLVSVEGTRLVPMAVDNLSYYLGGHVQYEKPGRGDNSPSPIVPPDKLVRQALAMGRGRGLKTLNAIVTAPTLRVDGSVVSEPGYDERSGLVMLCERARPTVPEHPTLDEVRTAVETLWRPFSDFPFVTELDRAVMLAALLTAVVRSSLPTAPAFAFDAPVQGSGKTLLSRCIGIFAAGEPPGVYATVRDDDEIRKRLTTIVSTGDRVAVWDNVLGVFDSGAMAAFLTSETWKDRILGATKEVTLPNKLITIFNGNNITFSGDMVRRVLTCRIDPRMEAPFIRRFDLNPAAYVRAHRYQLVVAALTIIRGYLARKPEQAEGAMASFEDWDEWVRQPVAWLHRDVLPDKFGDVMDVVITAQTASTTDDPLCELLACWHEFYGDDWKTVSDVLAGPTVGCGMGNLDENRRRRALRENLDAFVSGGARPGARESVSTRRLGKLLGFKVGVILGGLRLESENGPKGPRDAKVWRVVPVDGW